ncbi:MAG: Mut7-C RNAse domain-containing protein [Thermodesulfobacteriota bacterium]
MKERFVADCMLGRLAKWLRILGYDTLYERSRGKGVSRPPESLGDRRLLTRRRDLVKDVPGCVYIRSDHVGDQLCQMVREGLIHPDPEEGFRRCPSCNTELVGADPEDARDRIPEYVFFRHARDLLWCPLCKRYYWHGTHRNRMRAQLEVWGVLSVQKPTIERE